MTCLTAIFAGWAALETRNGAKETAKATRASVWLQLLNEYAQPEMLESMKALRQWQQIHSNNFAMRFHQQLLSTNADEQSVASKLDQHRRRVGSFFNKVRSLADQNVIDEETIGTSWSSTTFTYVTQVLLPFEKAKSHALHAPAPLQTQTETMPTSCLR